MKNKWRIFCASVLAATALASASTFLSADRREVLGHVDGLTDEEILQQLMELDSKNFKQEIERSFVNPDPEHAGCWGEALFKRANDYSDEELIEKIVSSKNTDELRYVWIEVYGKKHSEKDHNDPRLLSFLQDTEQSPNLRSSLMLYVRLETEEELAILQQLTQDQDEGLRFNAINLLNQISPNTAANEAWEIIERYQSGGDNRIQGAVDVIAQQLANEKSVRNSHWQREKEKLMAVCQQILESEPSQTLKDSVIYDMQLLGDWDALQMIVESPDVDQIMKKAIIDNNYYLLEEALLAPEPQAEDIRFAVDCMKILPIQDLHDPLEAALAAQPQAFSADEAEDLPALLDSMSEEGVKAKTWLKEDR